MIYLTAEPLGAEVAFGRGGALTDDPLYDRIRMGGEWLRWSATDAVDLAAPVSHERDDLLLVAAGLGYIGVLLGLALWRLRRSGRGTEYGLTNPVLAFAIATALVFGVALLSFATYLGVLAWVRTSS